MGFLLLNMMIGFSFAKIYPVDSVYSTLDDNDEIEDDDGDGIDNDNDEDDDNDGIDDDVEDWNRRSVIVTESEDRFIIESRANHIDRKDKIKFEVEYNDEGIGIRIKFSSESGDDDDDDSSDDDSSDDDSSDDKNILKTSSESGVELTFKVKFRSIIEYIDNDDNNIYNKDADTFVQEYELKAYKPLVHSTTNESGAVMHIFELSTADGVFSLTMYFTEEFAKIENKTLIAPTQTKFDIQIENFNYMETTSKLALFTKLESETEYEENDETEDEELNNTDENEEGVETNVNDYIGYFTWVNTAEIDGVDKEVLTTTIEEDENDEGEQKFYICYPRGILILHDPKIGVENTIATEDPTTTPFNAKQESVPGYNVILLLMTSGIGMAGIIFYLKKRQ